MNEKGGGIRRSEVNSLISHIFIKNSYFMCLQVIQRPNKMSSKNMHKHLDIYAWTQIIIIMVEAVSKFIVLWLSIVSSLLEWRRIS